MGRAGKGWYKAWKSVGKQKVRKKVGKGMTRLGNDGEKVGKMQKDGKTGI